MLTFSATRESELAEIAAFLHGVFGTPPDHRPFSPEVLRWKAYQPHPFWEGSRSYGIRQDGVLVAHGCVTPVEWWSAAGTVKASCVVDWAAVKTAPGAGALLFRKIAHLIDGLAAVGGSDDTRKVLPRFGFRERCQMAHFARTIQPLRHHWQAESRDWKTPARMLRDAGRNLQGASLRAPDGWSAERVDRFDQSLESALPGPGRPAAIVCRRTVDLLNYLLLCPAARMEGHKVLEGQKVMGYFILSTVGTECRICDIGAVSNDSWGAILAMATETAGRDRTITRIRFSTTAASLSSLALQVGLRQESEEPVFYWNSAQRDLTPGDYSMTLVDNDFFYL